MVHLHRSRPSHPSSHASRHSALALKRTRVVAVAVVLALVASISAAPMASAQEAPPPPTGDEATTLIPEIFEPGAIDRTPLGSEVPGGQPSTSTGSAGVREPGEVVEARTEDSATFLTEEGRFETILYGGPVHYLDAQEAWQPIDNSLVPAEGPNGGLRNAAGPVDVLLPAALGAEPVRVTKDDISVAFSLDGASASASPGTPEALPAAVTEATAKASATYANALPGVDVAYSANARGVKEDLVLAGPEAPTTFDFTVETSPGLTASETSAGGIDFLDGEGTAQASFSPPFAYDASFESTGAESAFTEDGVSLSIVETSPELVVRLAAEPAWLNASERVWPVVIDPVLVIKPADRGDTYVRKADPDTSHADNTRLRLGSGAETRRPMLFRDVAAAFDEAVTVPRAELQLYATTDTTGQAVSPVGAYEVATTQWNTSQATWNNRLTGTPWNTPGGDFNPQALFTNDNVTGAPGWHSWTITSSVQAWLDGQRPNPGLLLKYADESSGALISFASSNEADTSLLPRVSILWEALVGARDPFSFESFDLGPGGSASVNVASGNLTIAERDLGIPSTGLAATVDRFYQSRLARVGSVGARWRMWPQSEERLYLDFTKNQDVGVAGGPEELLIFSHNPDGSYTSPHGYRATMVKNPDGTYTLTSHGDGTRHNFFATGHTKDFTDRNGNTTTFGYTYDAASGEYFMSRMTDSQGRNTSFERAGEYKVTKMIDPAGRTHTYAYDRTDAKANLASYTDPAGKVTRYAYTGSALGLLSRVTDPNGNATAFTYDSRDRLTALTRITDPTTGTGPTWRFDYSTPWQTKVTDPNGNATTHHFDRMGRVHKVIDALGHARQASYDSNSNVTDRTSATGNKSIDTFHPVTSNLESSQLPTGAKTTLDYTDAAHKYSPTKLTNPQGNARSFGYDAPGNLKTVTDSMATAGITTFEYNANGTLASSTDAKGATTTYGYDAKGNRTSVTPPAPLGATTTAYDGLSRVTSTTDGKGQTTTYAYDALDRPTRVAFADGLVVTLGYDAGGRLVERADATGTTAYVYDRLNRVVEERLPGGRVNAYAYDATGNLASISDATGKVTYGYNAVNLATSVVEPGGHTTTFGYDDDDNRTTTTYPNGVAQRTAYDASGRLTSIDGAKGTTVLTRFAYTYTAASGDDTALRQSVTDKANKTTAYSYDALERLIQAQTKTSSGSVVDDFRYGYDAVGNRRSETVLEKTLVGTKDVTTNATFNAADQLESRGSVTYSYDPNGNQTASSAGQALAYNAADQTTSLKRAGGTALPATYASVGQSERATAGTTTFTNTLLGVSAGSEGGLLGSSVGYTRDPAGGLVGIRGANRSYYLFDGLGSVVAVTNSSGSVTNSYTYDPYGVTTETKAALTNVFNPWRYAGQYQDVATGLYKMGARYYQPELGRWTQRDPLQRAVNPDQPPEPHAYLYARANPINFVDPTGQLSTAQECAAAGLLVGATGAGAAFVATAAGGPAAAIAALGGAAFGIVAGAGSCLIANA